MTIDMPEDAPITPPKDLELGLTTSGNGSGRITSSPAGIDCGSTCTASFEDGTMVTLTAEPDTSSVFTGWGGACSGTTPVCEVTISQATSVTATFTLKTYTVTVTKAGVGSGTVAGNGINCGSTCEITVDHGTQISLTATPVSLNTFVGWGDACSGTGTCDLTITADTDISAAFALDDLSLIVTKGGNGDGTITSNPAGINCPGTCSFTYQANQMVSLTPAAAASSTFTGWGGACSGMGACSVTMDAAKAVTANFTLKRYALSVTKTGSTGTGTVTSAPAGIACGGDCTEDYNHGDMITLTAAATAGTSSFSGWSGGGCTGTAPCTVTLTAATTVNAVFAINSYALTTSVTGTGTITSSPAGIACPGDCTQNYTHGTVVNLTQMAGTGYTFMGWGGACSGMGACSVTMDQVRSVSATFTINSYNLDVSVTGLGTVTASPMIACPGDCQGTYTHGTVVTLTQLHGTGYTFTSWGGACSGSGACSVTMDDVKSVTALFTINSYALTVGSAGTGTGGVITATGISCPGDCTENFTHGTMVTVTQVPNGDSDFANWSGACTGTGACVVTMDAVKSVTANYTIKTHVLTAAVSGNGMVTATGIACPGDCTQTFNHGTMVTVSQSATSGNVFTGWSGACTGMSTCSVTMDMAQMVTASFSPVFTLDVTIAGSTGTVTSVPAGISCGTATPDCTQDYLDGTMVTLTAAGTGGATFASWSGATGCTTSTTCVVTMSAARSVTARFTPPSFLLTAQHGGNGFGTITSSPAGIDCSNNSGATNIDCTQSYVQGTAVTLTASPTTTTSASETSFFTGWTGACAGSSTQCTVTVDAAKTAVANFQLWPNVMFVTATTREMFGGGWRNAAASFCKAAADGSTRGISGVGPHQNTTWRAWVSGIDNGTVVNAKDALTGISGWERVDGQPMLQKISDIASNNIIYPPRIDQNGNDVGPAQITWTGTDAAGNYSGVACNAVGAASSWTGSTELATQGLASANSSEFTRFADATCAGTRRIYCFGADRKASITVNRKAGRLAFTTEGTFVPTSTGGPSGQGGLDAADELCRREASAAGLPRPTSYRALLATTSASAISRFAVDPSNDPWVRVGDQQPLTRSDSDMRNAQLSTLDVAPNVTATGVRLSNVETWSGASRPTEIGNRNGTCDDWKNPQQTKASGGYAWDTGIVQLWFGGHDHNLACTEARRLICMENLQ